MRAGGGGGAAGGPQFGDMSGGLKIYNEMKFK